MKASKGLSLYLSKLDEDLVEISKRSSRLHFNGELLDTYIKNPKTDDLYNGSDSNLDEQSDVGVMKSLSSEQILLLTNNDVIVIVIAKTIF